MRLWNVVVSLSVSRVWLGRDSAVLSENGGRMRECDDFRPRFLPFSVRADARRLRCRCQSPQIRGLTIRTALPRPHAHTHTHNHNLLRPMRSETIAQQRQKQKVEEASASRQDNILLQFYVLFLLNWKMRERYENHSWGEEKCDNEAGMRGAHRQLMSVRYLSCSVELSGEVRPRPCSLNRMLPSCMSLWQKTTEKSAASTVALSHCSSRRKSSLRTFLNDSASAASLVGWFFRISSSSDIHRCIVFHSQSGSFETGMFKLWIFAIFSATLHEIFGSLSSLVNNGRACAKERKHRTSNQLLCSYFYRVQTHLTA